MTSHRLTWRKSRRSEADGACVELAACRECDAAGETATFESQEPTICTERGQVPLQRVARMALQAGVASIIRSGDEITVRLPPGSPPQRARLQQHVLRRMPGLHHCVALAAGAVSAGHASGNDGECEDARRAHHDDGQCHYRS